MGRRDRVVVGDRPSMRGSISRPIRRCPADGGPRSGWPGASPGCRNASARQRSRWAEPKRGLQSRAVEVHPGGDDPRPAGRQLVHQPIIGDDRAARAAPAGSRRSSGPAPSGGVGPWVGRIANPRRSSREQRGAGVEQVMTRCSGHGSGPAVFAVILSANVAGRIAAQTQFISRLRQVNGLWG